MDRIANFSVGGFDLIWRSIPSAQFRSSHQTHITDGPVFGKLVSQQVQSTVKSFVVGISHNYSLPMECDVSDPAAQITRRSSLSSISVYSG